LDEREYLQASSAERAARWAVDQARLTREKTLERRTRNGLALVVLVLAVGVLVAFIMARLALDQQDVAEDRLDRLQMLSRTDQANAALDNHDPELALALASSLLDAQGDPPPAVRQMLYRAAYTPGARLVFDRHGAPVFSVAVSPDGTLAASGSGRLNPLGVKQDNRIRIWNTATGEEVRVLDGHTDSVLNVTFSPDGRLLASNGLDRTIILWDVETGELLRRLEGHGDWVNRTAFTPDGKTLLSTSGNFFVTVIPVPGLSSADASVRAWDVETGEEIGLFDAGDEGHQGPVMSLAISADGHYAATGDANGVIILWEISTGDLMRRMESPGDWVNALAFTPDGSLLVSGLGKPSTGGSAPTSTFAAIWDVQTGERVRNLVGHTNVVSAIAVSRDGRSILTGSADSSVRLWDLASGRELQRFIGHAEWVMGAALSPDGQWAVTCATDGTARVWELTPGNLIRRFVVDSLPPIYAARLSDDGRIVLTGHVNGLVLVWDTATGQILHRLGEDSATHTAAVYAVAMSHDNTLAVSSDEAGAVTLWDLTTGAELRHFQAHPDSVWAVAMSPDGRQIATASGQPQGTQSDQDTAVRLWDVATGEELRRFEGHPYSVWGLAFSPDGHRLVSTSGSLLEDNSGSIRVWDVDS
ncbi:MAG: WD40 repeat domain-containing protein, partial [Chloroflexi bacterium]